jgi:hypothetical protein
MESSEKLDTYTLGADLGAGAFGKVKIGTNPSGQRFAIKYLEHSNENY